MTAPPTPSGFRTWWDESVLFARLPDVVETASHRMEPVLSGADARRLAEAVLGKEARGTARPPAERLVLVSDPRYAEVSIAAFRDRLVAALAERGLRTVVEITREGGSHASVDTLEPARDEKPRPSPPAPETLSPERPRPAPIPKRRRLPGEGHPRLA